MFLFLLLLISTSTLAQQKMPNIDYLQFGYDLMQGNPTPTSSVDPGFRLRNIFLFDYSSGGVTADGRYSIPDNTSLVPLQSCSLDFQSSTITGETSYKNSIEQSVTVEGGAFGATFSASVDYKQVSSGTNTNKEIYLITEGLCSVYVATLNPFVLPSLHPGFIKTVSLLNDEYNQTQYLEFIQYFGTHYFTAMTMGARYGYYSTITQDGWTRLESNGVTVSAAASYSGAFSIGVKSLTDVQKEEAQKFDSEKTSWKAFSLGSKPPSDASVNSWAQQAIDQPAPIAYAIDSISSLLTTQNFAENLFNITAKKANMDRALGEYCNYLQQIGQVTSCVGPSGDNSLPKIKNSCRFCSNSCGGRWSEDLGTMSADSDWPAWSYTYDNQCNGQLAHRGGPVKMCCPQESDVATGSCRLCNSCGGTFPSGAGAVMVDQNWPNWIRAFDNQCNGDLRSRPNPSNGIQVCCTEPVCSLCASCGGDYPNESGVIGDDQFWPNFFLARGEACEGNARSVAYSDGIKLCCYGM
eukprot:TRINITY_DN10592_c0_g2_i4.p1 TRINITY_DN10592_c0_g2~~TRINITY_DN10592_c0_g2_i4.p1  ORF type:complete len:522 (-),score=74.41 TRINITY_DN10592_c0_g2_i4:155-1720(-)